jgi:hypothetical protein
VCFVQFRVFNRTIAYRDKKVDRCLCAFFVRQPVGIQHTAHDEATPQHTVKQLQHTTHSARANGTLRLHCAQHAANQHLRLRTALATKQHLHTAACTLRTAHSILHCQTDVMDPHIHHLDRHHDRVV